jgi:hypothetical protein
MVPIKPYRDDEGRLRAGAAPGSEVLADFLETELHENPHTYHELASALAGVRAGAQPSHRYFGNLYSLTLEPGRVRIANEHDDQAPGCDLALDDFQRLLESWRGHFTPEVRAELTQLEQEG